MTKCMSFSSVHGIFTIIDTYEAIEHTTLKGVKNLKVWKLY